LDPSPWLGRPLAEDLRQRDAVGRALADDDRVAGADGARLEHPEIRPGPPHRRESLDPVLFADERPKRRARNSRARDLENDAADMPLLADDGAVHVEPCRRQVLAEDARAKLAPKRAFPVVQVFARKCIDGLIDAAVVTPIGLLVALEAERADLHGT